jgi:mannosylglycerate hydrolase
MDKKYTVHVVPHTHWDREWYFTFEEFRYRLVKMMDRLIRLMQDGVIEHFVADGHTLMIDDYLEIRPEKEVEVRELIGSGRLLLGPWYTQPNIYMSSGEAQIRNLLRGRQEMQKYGDSMEMAEINYLPDMFGYHAQLPQIMKGFGMTHLIGARGMPLGSPNYFRWEGSDGTTVMVCSLLNSYNNGNGLSDREEPKYFYVFGEPIKMPSLPEILNLILEERSERDRAVAPHLLLLNGVDHMWANPTMKETLKKIEQLRPELITKQSTFRKYIDEMETSLENDPLLYTGEHRDPRQVLILPASQSMRMDVKKYNRSMEDLLERRVEPLMSLMLCIGEKDLPYAMLAKAWEYVLMNQAHDSLCCALSEPGYREVLTRYDKAADIAREIHTELEQRLLRRMKGCPEEAVMVLNPTPKDRLGIVTMDIAVAHDPNSGEPHLYYDGSEIPIHIQSVRNDMLLRYVPFSGLVGQLSVRIFTITANTGIIPASGYKTLEIRLGSPHAKSVEGLVKGTDIMENEHLRVKVNPDATLDITDLSANRVYSGVHRFIDDGENGCGFMHIPPVNDHVCISAGKNLDLRIIENNPHKGVLRVSHTMSIPDGLSADSLSRSRKTVDLTIKTDIILRQDSKIVEFETEIENPAGSHRLRVAFPTDVDSNNSYSGLPFDVIVRPVQPEEVNYVAPGTYEAFYGYHPMHDFCGITDGKEGAALAGDGMLEFEVLPMRRTMCMTLLRATDHLHVGVLYHGSKFRLPSAQLIGKQHYRYAFIPHNGDYSKVLDLVEEFRHPIFTAQKDFLEEESMPDYNPPPETLSLQGSFIRVDSRLVTTAIKPAEDGEGIILRMYNPLHSREKVHVTIPDSFVLKSAVRVRIDESNDEEIPVIENGFTLNAAAKEIISIRLNIVIKEGADK